MSTGSCSSPTGSSSNKGRQARQKGSHTRSEQRHGLFQDPTDEQVARLFAGYDVEGTGSISTVQVAGEGAGMLEPALDTNWWLVTNVGRGWVKY